MGCEHILYAIPRSFHRTNKRGGYWSISIRYIDTRDKSIYLRGVFIYRVILISNLELGEDTRDQNSIHILLDTMGIIVKGVQSMFIMEMINNEFELYATEVARW